MSAHRLIQAAARNNAEWHAAVCRSHGLASQFTSAAWLCDGDPPPYYGRFVGLTDDPNALEAAITGHRRLGSGEWGCKDSYRVLGDAPNRRKLFDAVWYAREPGPLAIAPAECPIVRDETELAAWVAAWGETPEGRPVFVPDILREPRISFVHDGTCRGGCVPYRSRGEDVVGLTNFFGDPAALHTTIRAVIAGNPGCTVVGYGPDREAEQLAQLGFHALGPLTVWIVSDLDM